MEKEEVPEEVLEDYQKRKQYNKMHGENPPIKGVRSKAQLKSKVIMDNAKKVCEDQEG